MYKTLHIIALGLTALIASTSCQTMDDSERFIRVPVPEVARTALLLDFTGQNCTNCPKGHAIIEALEGQYPDNFIAVSVHAGSFGLDDKDGAPITGLKQPVGDILAKRYGIDAYPEAIVDGAGPYDLDAWSTEVAKAIATPSHITLDAVGTLRGSELLASAEVTAGEHIGARVHLWLVQSGITAYQNDGGKPIMQYTHNNVLRTCLNGVDGTAVELPASLVSYTEATFTLPERWGTEGLAVVAFVTDADGNVLQSARASVTPVQ